MRTRTKNRPVKSRDSEAKDLRERLEQAEETLRAIRQGEVDALVVSGPGGDQVFSLKGAETPYRLLIETMNEGALTVLADSTILYCNKRFAEMVRTPAKKIIGSRLDQLREPAEQTAVKQILEIASGKGRQAEFTLWARKSADALLPAQLSFRSLEIDGVNALCVVATDLTEPKRLERDLQRQNEQLEQRVAARPQELTQTNEVLRLAHEKLNEQARLLEKEVASRTVQLEQSIRSLEEFCYTIAHECFAPTA